MNAAPRPCRAAVRRSLPPLVHITAAAQTLPAFELSFLSDGHTFKALIRARNAQAAAAEGLIELAQQCPDFNPDGARLVSALQTL